EAVDSGRGHSPDQPDDLAARSGSRRDRPVSETEDRPVDGLIVEALEAARRGDTAEARLLAGDALRQDPENRDAAEIARLSDSSPAELRRLTIMFCDLVGSTAMSGRHDPGEYGRMLELYHRNCED